MRTLRIATILLTALAASAATAQVDTSKYVAMGDSLTAGWTNGGLGQPVQDISFPAQLAAQIGITGFEQPTISAPGIPAQLELVSLVPLNIAAQPGSGAPTNLGLPRPYDNLGVPGASAFDVLNTVSDGGTVAGGGGGFHDIILRGLGTQLEQAISLNPTFITFWVGSNDVLGAATSGIVIDDVTLTTEANFAMDYIATLDVITMTTDATLVLGNIPDVTTIPYVTTIPPVLIDPATNEPVLVGGLPVPLLGTFGDGSIGPLGEDDFVLLPATAALEMGIGVPAAVGGTGLPLPDSLVLDADEAATIKTRTINLNAIILSRAAALGAPLADVSAELDEIATNGLSIGGIEYASDYLTGGMFSLDGVHPTEFGFAYIANLFIEAANSAGADIPLIDLYDFVFANGTDATRLPPGVAASSVAFEGDVFAGLREALGIPSTEELMEIKARRRLERRRFDRRLPEGAAPGGVDPQQPRARGGIKRDFRR